ncbi:hypothetical protein [Halomarina oriensis]|uniref:Uncharacterized protein n=1 Tax=Halomarina oriensis TaxID=671145 RepID=A0A6B0GXU7_9EURY|nr:hypothetical protein [Halomarina oriensis]MWG36608.1 hypothetical protein [Halomarina oriensis]
MPTLLTDQSTTLTVCPACRVVYNFDPVDDDCFDCGTVIDSVEEGYEFDLEFPVNDDCDGAIASLTGTLCGDCAAHLGLDILFNGINCRNDPHKRLLTALGCPDSSLRHSTERSRRDCWTEGPV